MKTKRFWKITRRILCGVLLTALAALLTLYVIPLTETVDPTQVEGSADWMAAVADERLLNTVTLPGTHDSATCYAQLGFFSKCQALPIAEQLEAGYRYLDIRLALDGENLILAHGFTNCKTGPLPWDGALKLDDVLAQCDAFLAEHPTEVIVFAVKQERGEEPVAAFQAALDRCIQKKPERWLLTDKMPCLGEARGKLVLMRRYGDEAGLGARAGLPLLWQTQYGSEDPSLNTVREENGDYALWIQDRYEYDAEEKWAAFTAGMENADCGERDIALHFLSTKGTAAYGHPYFYAERLNKLLLEEHTLRGWIVVDFGSARIAEKIYRMN